MQYIVALKAQAASLLLNKTIKKQINLQALLAILAKRYRIVKKMCFILEVNFTS